MNSHVVRNAFLTMSLAALVAIPVRAANVSTDYDHNVDFRSYHTFSFYKVQTSDPLFEQRIKDEVTKDLTEAGWQAVANGGDIAITAIGNVHTENEYNTFYNNLGGGGWGWRGWGGWGGGWGTSQTTVEKVPMGTLMLDMYDRNTHQLVWRGRSTAELSDKADKNAKTMEKDIDKMFNGFPPKTKV
jgi:hypothetical protein